MNYILFSFCPADAAIVANIPLANICMIYWQHLTPKSTCLQSPYLLLVHNNRFFILNEVTISVIVQDCHFFLQVSCSCDDLLLLFCLFLFYIKYLKLLTIENTVLIFQFYK
jgi:hypothetical protein